MLIQQTPTTAERVYDFFMERIIPVILLVGVLVTIAALAHSRYQVSTDEPTKMAECQSWFDPPSPEIDQLVDKICAQRANAWLLPPGYDPLEVAVATSYLKTDANRATFNP